MGMSDKSIRTYGRTCVRLLCISIALLGSRGRRILGTIYRSKHIVCSVNGSSRAALDKRRESHALCAMITINLAPNSSENVGGKPRLHLFQPFSGLFHGDTFVFCVDSCARFLDPGSHPSATAEVHLGAILEHVGDRRTFMPDSIPESARVSASDPPCDQGRDQDQTYWTYLHSWDADESRENA